MTTDDRLLAALEALAARYPRWNPPPETIAGYVEDLRDLPVEAVESALMRIRKMSTWPPSVGEIRGEVANLAANPDEIAEAAWVEVEREIRRVGYNRLPLYRNGEPVAAEGPRFSSPLIRQTVESVGWAHLCTADQTKVNVRLDFILAYRALRERTIRHIQRGGFSDALPAIDQPSDTPIEITTRPQPWRSEWHDIAE